jgi:hypothetical protein
MLFRATFTGFEIESQTVQSSDPAQDHLVARVYLDLEVDGTGHTGVCVEGRQPYGTNYSTEPIEVRLAPDSAYRGPFPLLGFSDELERYYRAHVGPNGRLLSFDDGFSVQVQDTAMASIAGPYHFELVDVAGGWILTGDFMPMPRAALAGTASPTPFADGDTAARIGFLSVNSGVNAGPGIPFPKVHRGKTFVGQTLLLDENIYIGCRFESCNFVYFGSTPVNLDGEFVGAPPKIYLEGAARQTVRFLQLMHEKGAPFRDFLDGIINAIGPPGQGA